MSGTNNNIIKATLSLRTKTRIPGTTSLSTYTNESRSFRMTVETCTSAHTFSLSQSDRSDMPLAHRGYTLTWTKSIRIPLIFQRLRHGKLHLVDGNVYGFWGNIYHRLTTTRSASDSPISPERTREVGPLLSY